MRTNGIHLWKSGYYRAHESLYHGLLTCIRYLAAKKLGYSACIEFNGNMLKKQGLTDSDMAAMVENPVKTQLLAFVLRGNE